MLRTEEEEVINAATHFLAAVATVLVTFLIISLVQDRTVVLPLCIMSLTATWAFFSSFLYHSSRNEAKRMMNCLVDRAGIYIMIAGNGVGLGLAHSQSTTSIICCALLIVACTLSIVNLCLNKRTSETALVLSYVMLGWAAILPSIGFLITDISINRSRLFFLLGGALAYSIGVVFYTKDHIKWHHTIWHLFVILGFCLHLTGSYVCLV